MQRKAMTESVKDILGRREAGERLSRADLTRLLESPDWTPIVAAGHAERLRRHAPDAVTYACFRIVNYTSVCSVGCSFCSFQDSEDSSRGYTLSLAEVEAKTLEAKEWGCDAIFFQGGVNRHLPLSYYVDCLSMIRSHGLSVRGFSPVEIVRLAGKEGMAVPELLSVLKQAGLSSVPGAGAEILTERMRQVLSPAKLSMREWCDTMGECHRLGLPGSCNIVFGSCETVQDIVEHLAALRDQQDLTGGFQSFIPWIFQPQTKDFPIRHVRSWEYLRLLAASRLFLDNIDHVEVSVMVMGRELAELGLHAGADDVSSVVFEENVLASRGLKTVRAAERYIDEAGFVPRRRSIDHVLL
jgi:cyclic dehypoxanthinyl futalosine synthase